MASFARELETAMDRAGLTAAELAEKSGLTESAISYLRSGRRSPNLRTIQRLAAVLPELGPNTTVELGATPGFDSIEDAIADVRAGKMVIVLDDQDRENEGDLVIAAEMCGPTPSILCAARRGGLICVPIIGRRLDELQIPPMVTENTAPTRPRSPSPSRRAAHDHRHLGAGPRRHDRRAAGPAPKPTDFLRPGHTFPLRASEGGVLVRAGHTEAAVDLARLAGLYPAGVIVEIMDDDGTMMRPPKLRAFAKQHRMQLITVKDLIAFRMRTERLVQRIAEFELPTPYGDFRGVAYETTLDKIGTSRS